MTELKLNWSKLYHGGLTEVHNMITEARNRTNN